MLTVLLLLRPLPRSWDKRYNAIHAKAVKDRALQRALLWWLGLSSTGLGVGLICHWWSPIGLLNCVPILCCALAVLLLLLLLAIFLTEMIILSFCALLREVLSVGTGSPAEWRAPVFVTLLRSCGLAGLLGSALFGPLVSSMVLLVSVVSAELWWLAVNRHKVSVSSVIFVLSFSYPFCRGVCTA